MTITKGDTLSLIDAALDDSLRGATIHLRGSGYGRFIVGGVGTSLRLPMHQVRHPATVGFLTSKIDTMLREHSEAETVGSWRDEFSGDVYIDLGSTHDSRDDAVYYATQRGERAIFDSHDNSVEWV